MVGWPMGFDRHRVMEVFVEPAGGPGRVGSGYRVTADSVLTAAHVVAGLRVCGHDESGGPGERAGRCEVRPLGVPDWVSGWVLWRDETADVALIGLPAVA